MDLAAILISQYQASLEMLKQTITLRLGTRTGAEIDWVGWKRG